MKKEEDFLKEMQSSLAKQVRKELGEDEEVKKEKMDNMRETRRKRRRRKKRHLLLKVFLIFLVTLSCLGIFFTFTKPGRKVVANLITEYVYRKLDSKNVASGKGIRVDNNKEESKEETLEKGEITENIDLSQMSDTFRRAMHEDGVYNILLLGVESIGNINMSSGRSDSIMIATINTKKNTLGLTSLMRDSYVNIPGHYKTRINAAYSLGGIPLVYETIAENYGLRLDGAVAVGFDVFQKVVDDLGGIDIEITKEECDYLNHTNYISKKSNRNLKPGLNHMNGNQALGYARVRKVATLDGSRDDMGRTSRHRRVMNAIFNKVKKSNPMTLLTLLDTIFSEVQTDIKKSNASSYLAALMDLSIEGVPLDTMRLPEDGAYFGEKINGAWVLGVDWEKTKNALTNFVFGSHAKPKESTKVEASENKQG